MARNRLPMSHPYDPARYSADPMQPMKFDDEGRIIEPPLAQTYRSRRDSGEDRLRDYVGLEGAKPYPSSRGPSIPFPPANNGRKPFKV